MIKLVVNEIAKSNRGASLTQIFERGIAEMSCKALVKRDL